MAETLVVWMRVATPMSATLPETWATILAWEYWLALKASAFHLATMSGAPGGLG